MRFFVFSCFPHSFPLSTFQKSIGPVQSGAYTVDFRAFWPPPFRLSDACHTTFKAPFSSIQLSYTPLKPSTPTRKAACLCHSIHSLYAPLRSPHPFSRTRLKHPVDSFQVASVMTTLSVRTSTPSVFNPQLTHTDRYTPIRLSCVLFFFLLLLSFHFAFPNRIRPCAPFVPASKLFSLSSPFSPLPPTT